VPRTSINWDTLKGKNGLLITYEPMPGDLREDLSKAFISFKLYKSIKIYRKNYGNTPIRTVDLYLCKEFKGKDFTTQPELY